MAAERPTGDSQRATRQQVPPLRHGAEVVGLCVPFPSNVTVPRVVGLGGAGFVVFVVAVGDGGATVVVVEGGAVVVVVVVVVVVELVVVELDDEGGGGGGV